jgi:hypothetical protein
MMSRSPEQVAWITLIVSFIVFILTGVGATFGARWFVLSSTVGLETHVLVGRGTVGVRPVAGGTSGAEAVRSSRQLGRRELVTTDEIAQGTIQFVDAHLADRVIANATILPGSQIELFSAERPRFNLGDNHYFIELGSFEGRLEIDIPPDLPKAIELKVQGSRAEVILTEPGLYLLWSLPNSSIVIARRGQALMESPAVQSSVEVAPGLTGVVSNSEASVNFTTTELVRNALFLDSSQPGVADSWGCYSFSENPDAPRGIQQLLTINGRRGLHIMRSGEDLGYGETGCQQFLGQRRQGLDVSDFRTLRIRATLDIDWHSLAVCGVQASECALMLELSYLNDFGLEQRWIHGFYAFEHVNPEVPRTCDSCLTEHERITPGNWYTYESGNLFELPEGFRPARLMQIRFYSSGHEYDVTVGEIALLGER